MATSSTTTTMADDNIGMSGGEAVQQLMATLELQYFKAVSLYRRRNYEKCVEVCNAMLQAGQQNNVQMFTVPTSATTTTTTTTKRQAIPMLADENADSSYNVGANTVYAYAQDAVVSVNRSNLGNMGSYSISRYGSNLQRNAPKHNAAAWLDRRGGNVVAVQEACQDQVAAANNNKNTKNRYKTATPTPTTATTTTTILPTWMMEGVWQLKMRALTQRVYIDDLETNDIANEVHEEAELERIATAARPSTSIKTAFIPRPRTSIWRTTASGREQAANISTATRKIFTSVPTTARPISGVARPGTGISRPGTATGVRCGTAARIRAISASAYTVGDATAALYQASKHNPTIYAERAELVKTLFQFLYYHESDVQKAHALCQAVIDLQQQQLTQHKSSNTQRQLQLNADSWWWQQQLGRCLLSLRYLQQAELHLQNSLKLFEHPDTYLLLSRLYKRRKSPQSALTLITAALDKFPFNVQFRLEQGLLFDELNKPDDALAIYRLICKLNPVNIEALAGIADNYFYDNNPELALMYYRRILNLGVHTAELYCNIGLCCLYGGQIDLVLPCFQRALAMVKTSDQKADIWYNLSFVAITTGDFILARRCLQLCLVSDAHNAAALNNLAVLAAHGADYAKAKSYLTAARHLVYDAAEIEKNWQFLQTHYKI